jgi:polyferredoxin
MTMTHPGLPLEWVLVVCAFMLLFSSLFLLGFSQLNLKRQQISIASIPLLRPIIKHLSSSPWPLITLKLFMVCLFLLIIIAGLFGSPIAERNIATVLTWNIWWAGLIVSVFFLGSAWCAVCPWDAMATWLVRRRLWKRASPNNSLNLKVPRRLRSVWPALLMLVALTWLELGVGITTSPYMTAMLALLMLVLATVSLALYEGKAFCRYFCPVGRTIGFYSQLAPVELRPINPDVCLRCKTLDCYHGTEVIEACPTNLTMGRLKQNTYCTSCGNCSQSCPDNNVAWRLRSPSQEAIQDARPHNDEAWFMVVLLAITAFHGITMLPLFETGLSQLATGISDSGQLLWSFSLLLLLSIVIPLLIYLGFVSLTQKLTGSKLAFKKLFSGLAFVALPLAFVYHLAHNLNHLLRESADFSALLANPLGIQALPLSMMELHMRQMEILIPQDALFALQAALMTFGFWISLKVIQHRGNNLMPLAGWRLSPMIAFAALVTCFHLWLLSQPMVMRM